MDQALSKLALLIPQELARGSLVDRREMRREVSQPLTGQHVVDLDESAQIALRRAAQEGREPDQRPRPRIAPAEVVETRKVVGRRMARLVEGKIDHHLAFVRARRERFVRQLPHVGEDHLEAALRAAPGDLVVEHDLIAILDPELGEQDLPDQAAPIPGVVVPISAGEDALGIDRRELEGDRRVGRVVADPDFPDLRGPGAAAPQHLLAFASLESASGSTRG